MNSGSAMFLQEEAGATYRIISVSIATDESMYPKVGGPMFMDVSHGKGFVPR
jgi:hypothetical protein